MTPNEITDIRCRMRLNKQEFAERIRVRPEAVTRYESGQRAPTGAVLERIREAIANFADPTQPRILKSHVYQDHRGTLRVWGDLPFPVVRAFTLADVPAGETRGNHAHKTCDQIISTLVGTVRLNLIHQNGDLERFELKTGVSVYVPRMIWIRLMKFQASTVVSVLCSEQYKPESDYTDRVEFFKDYDGGVE